MDFSSGSGKPVFTRKLTALEADRLKVEAYREFNADPHLSKYSPYSLFMLDEVDRVIGKKPFLFTEDTDRQNKLRKVALHAGFCGVYDPEEKLGDEFPDVSAIRIAWERVIHPIRTRKH
jgi:hypothetical protein